MRIFKSRVFGRFCRKEGLADSRLLTAVSEIERGLADADLGGGVYKHRIARRGAGKSGGFRAIVLFRVGAHAFFVYGFAKSDRANLRDDEVEEFKKLAAVMLAYTDDELGTAVANGALIEVIYG